MLATGRALQSNPRVLSSMNRPWDGPVLVDSIFETIRQLMRAARRSCWLNKTPAWPCRWPTGVCPADRSILLSDTAESLRKNEMVRQAYLGGSTS